MKPPKAVVSIIKAPALLIWSGMETWSLAAPAWPPAMAALRSMATIETAESLKRSGSGTWMTRLHMKPPKAAVSIRPATALLIWSGTETLSLAAPAWPPAMAAAFMPESTPRQRDAEHVGLVAILCRSFSGQLVLPLTPVRVEYSFNFREHTQLHAYTSLRGSPSTVPRLPERSAACAPLFRGARGDKARESRGVYKVCCMWSSRVSPPMLFSLFCLLWVSLDFFWIYTRN